jgi:hypothetical protein
MMNADKAPASSGWCVLVAVVFYIQQLGNCSQSQLTALLLGGLLRLGALHTSWHKMKVLTPNTLDVLILYVTASRA